MTKPETDEFLSVLDKISRKVRQTFSLKASIYHNKNVHDDWQANAILMSNTKNPDPSEWDESLLLVVWPMFLKNQFQLAYPQMRESFHGDWQAKAVLVSNTENPDTDEWDEALLLATWPAFLKNQFQLAYPQMRVEIEHRQPAPIVVAQGLSTLCVIITLHTLAPHKK